jgi:hypothetical protein
MVQKQMKRTDAPEAEAAKIFLSRCPHLHLWPVPSCHAKDGRIHIQSDQTVENFCTTTGFADCSRYLQRQGIGAIQ